ncbi:uncharacterized protein [Nicotiana sylvestris]|uniref:uncharacterized protein n=1 Tax=Nicotiana sylvestris TaxID=4096 RepID=UPI00388C60D4
MFGKTDQMNTDRESSVPIRKYGGQYEREFRDAHLDDETENVTDIGKAASEEAGVQYQEKTGLQSQDIGRSEIGSKSIDATCDDDDVAGMILDIANESCQQASKDHGEQLQDKENVELQEKENVARNILAEFVS